MNAVNRKFYSYLWMREDGTPYYAGKGTERRAFVTQNRRFHCPADSTRILVFPMLNEAEAFESEVALIELFGRKDLGTGCLRNLTDGGEGCSGKSEKAMRAALRNVKKAADAVRGKSFTEEHCQNISKALTGCVFTEAHRCHISASKKGITNPKLCGDRNPRWGKKPTNVESLRVLNAARPRDARGRFYAN